MTESKSTEKNVSGKMTAGVVKEQKLEKHIEKQMGCMAGFLQIFDRHQLLNGKRLYSAKRLPPSVSTQAEDSCEESEQTIANPAASEESENQPKTKSIPSPDRFRQSPTVSELRSSAPGTPVSVAASQPPKSPLPLSGFEFKESTKFSWKFAREAPRLSLDSRASTDSEGILHSKVIRTNSVILNARRCDNSWEGDDSEKQRRSPSVIGRLMGLGPLPESSDPEPAKKAELRRSASESRVSKDLYQYRFVDCNTSQSKQSHQTNSNYNVANNVIRGNAANQNRTYSQRLIDPNKVMAREVKTESLKALHKSMGQRKSFDSADVFPEPKQSTTVYNDFEKRLKMRGINEPSKDLETFKQILEAVQLKGLLRSKKRSNQINSRNFVYDQNFLHDESPIVVMKPSRSSVPMNRPVRIGSELSPSSFRSRQGACRNINFDGETMSSPNPRRDLPVIDGNARNHNRGRNLSTSSRCESNVKSPNRRRPLSNETQTRKSNNDVMEQKRASPVQSPKFSPRRVGSVQHTTNRSPRNKKPMVEIYTEEEKLFPAVEDESSTMSESSISTSSQTDTDRSKMEEYRDGKGLLERCDKLLHNIAEFTISELQPSPVSVLDSPFYKEDSSPSPIMKRSIDFKDQLIEQEDDTLSMEISAIESNDCDLVYISEILRASNYLPEDSDVFLLLEKQQHLQGKDTSMVSRLQRRLIFDTINEIVNRNRELPLLWKVVSLNSKSGLKQIWSEFQRIRERYESEDMFEVICGVLRKDLAEDGIYGWGNCPIEMSGIVLDIERLIFKDLIGETVRDLAAYGIKFSKISASFRKLMF